MPSGGSVRPLRLLAMLGWFAAWVGLSTLIAAVVFTGSERNVDFAGHEATVSPDFAGRILLDTGPILPDLRLSSGSWLGLEIELGKTDTASLSELTARYAAIASQPEGQIATIRRTVATMALAAAVQGGALGVLPFLVWAAIGAERRRDLVRQARSRRGVVLGLALVFLAAAVIAPLRWGRTAQDEPRWITLMEYVGTEIDLPAEARSVEISTSITTAETRRLITSAVSSYEKGLTFYNDAADAARDLVLREPEEDETVVVLVSDRHLNVGMDKVARAIGDQAGATAIFDAGDDTSTGQRWESFSLDSVSAAFDDYDGHWAVAGNHDHGEFVRSHMEDLGWTYFDGEVVDGPGDSRILGVDDPRSSGLGNWRDETGLSSADVTDRLTEAVCDADEAGDRVNTLLLHDADYGDEALARGCVDLVLGGHTHVQTGPDPVVAEDGRVGYTYTNGTTGGAAYAIAIGSKLRRAAGISLITYRDGRPVGIQAIDLQTNGRFTVNPWVELDYPGGDESDESDGASPGAPGGDLGDRLGDLPSGTASETTGETGNETAGETASATTAE